MEGASETTGQAEEREVKLKGWWSEAAGQAWVRTDEIEGPNYKLIKSYTVDWTSVRGTRSQTELGLGLYDMF